MMILLYPFFYKLIKLIGKPDNFLFYTIEYIYTYGSESFKVLKHSIPK